MQRIRLSWVLGAVGLAIAFMAIVLLRDRASESDDAASNESIDIATPPQAIQSQQISAQSTSPPDSSDKQGLLPTTLGKTYWDWTRAIVDWLVQRDDAESLTVAALLVRSPWYGGDVELDRAARSRRVIALVERASQKGSTVPALHWVALVVCQDAASQGGECNDSAFDQQFRAIDPGNALLGLSALERATQQRDTTAQADAIAVMARGERFTQYHAIVAPLILNTIESVRVSAPPAKAGQRLSPPQELAMELINSVPQPRLTSLAGVCSAPPNKAAADDCRRVSDLLRSADTYLAQTQGLNIAERVAPFGTIQASQVIDARRKLEWIAYQIGRLGITPIQTLRVLPEAGGEVEAGRMLLSENGIALEPPTEWVRP